MLPAGRDIRAAAVRAHFARAGGPIELGASQHLELPICVTGVDERTGELVLNESARIVTAEPLVTAAGHVYAIEGLLPLG